MSAFDMPARRNPAPPVRVDRPSPTRRRPGTPGVRGTQRSRPGEGCRRPVRSGAVRPSFAVPFDDALDPAFDEVGDLDGHLDGLAAHVRADRARSGDRDDPAA